MRFLRNIWYVAAWADEIAGDTLLPRTLLDERILFFRDTQGEIQAIADRCPHRFAPLHMGRHEGDAVRCGYHGLAFDGRGRCVHNPHGSGAIPRSAAVQCYPVTQRHGAIWIWMGDPVLADPDAIPDFHFNDPDRYIVAKRYLHVKANYMLETDNIMDLSHIQYLHPGTLGSDNVSTATIELLQDGDTIWSKRLVHAERLPDFLYKANGIAPGTIVDRWIDVRWDAPANMVLYVGAVPAGQDTGDRRGRPITHHFTPETQTTSHYWFANSYPESMGEAGVQVAQAHIDALNRPFADEDLPMLEAQQNMMGEADFWALKPILLPSDAPGIRARRVLARLIAAEESGAQVRKPASAAGC